MYLKYYFILQIEDLKIPIYNLSISSRRVLTISFDVLEILLYIANRRS
nr:MAG TPA: hypothetical protein [Caudoviricetes sp.]